MKSVRFHSSYKAGFRVSSDGGRCFPGETNSWGLGNELPIASLVTVNVVKNDSILGGERYVRARFRTNGRGFAADYSLELDLSESMLKRLVDEVRNFKRTEKGEDVKQWLLMTVDDAGRRDI